MANEKKYRRYTAADIEKYHKGLLLPQERHEIEKAALDDPFLADALEGYGVSSPNIAEDISGLEKKLQQRISGTKVVSMVSPNNSFRWWKIAVAMVIIGGLGYTIFQISTSSRNESIAKVEVKKIQPSAVPVNDSTKKIQTETTTVATTKNKALKVPTTERRSISNLNIPSRSTNASPDENKKPEASLSYHLNDGRSDTVNKTKNPVALTPFAKAIERDEEVKQRDEMASGKKETAPKNEPGFNYFHGHVTDRDNNPLPFANITNIHDNVGTYADAQGNFTLISPDSVLDVQVRSVGFEKNISHLRNDVAGNKVILKDDQAVPDKVISYQKPDRNRFLNGNMKLEEPEPADGWTNYDTYLANNINVPDDLRIGQDKAHVDLSFEVNENGDPINIRVEKSLCQKCDEEAMRLVKQGPKWKKKTKKVKRITIRVPFDAR